MTSVPARLAAFATVLAVAFAVAFGIGAAVDNGGRDPAPATRQHEGHRP